MHENQLFLGRNATKKLDFVLFLEKSCIFCTRYSVRNSRNEFKYEISTDSNRKSFVQME